MPADVLEKPEAVGSALHQGPETGAVATAAVRNREESAQRPLSKMSDTKPISLRQRIGMLLREVFEGHNEYLGWTPD